VLIEVGGGAVEVDLATAVEEEVVEVREPCAALLLAAQLFSMSALKLTLSRRLWRWGQRQRRRPWRSWSTERSTKGTRSTERTWRSSWGDEDHHRMNCSSLILNAVLMAHTSLQEKHRHPGVFIARGKEDLLVTKNMTPGESVYGEKRISVESPAETTDANGDPSPATKTEYRVWNPFRSKLAAGILGGLDDIYIKPGAKVLYLGAASGTSVSHVADVVGPTGTVFAVEFSHRSGRDLINMATHRTNVSSGSKNSTASVAEVLTITGHPHRRRCASPEQISHARLHGRRGVCRRRSA